ncbi:MAG: leucine-rich repeat domain-containing protein [Lachnospiraceae bacterium]|nr:leucine-rich repeat domain-containing protein [Lachnospiraceae bacterium]
MKKIALALALAMTMTSVGGNTFAPVTDSVYAAEVETNAAQKIKNELFNKEIENNNITFKLKNGVLTVSGTGVADTTYLNRYKADDIKEIVIESGVTAVGDRAFANLKKCKKVTIPNTVTKLGIGAFAKIKLDKLVIPKSVKEIGIECMLDGEVKSLTMPGNFKFVLDKEIEEYLPEYDSYYNINIEPDCVYTILPKTEDLYFNTTFNPNLMQFFKTANKVHTYKNDKKYKTYDNLIYTKNGKKLVYVPTSVKNLKIRKGCKTVSLKSFTYQEVFGDSVSNLCRNLKTVSIPSSVKNIIADSSDHGDDGETYGKIKIKFASKKVSGNVLAPLADYFGESFRKKVYTSKYGVKNQNGMQISYDNILLKYTGKSKTVKLSNKINSIGSGAFEGTKVTKVILPSNLKKIDDGAFKGARKLKTVKLPKNITKIGNSAFEGCSFLENVKFPKNITKIGNSAFEGCSSLKKVTFSKKLKSIGAYAFSSTGLKKVTIPNSVNKVGDYAFGYTSVSSVTLSKNMTEIPDGMFKDANLKKIKLPAGITRIGEKAFLNNQFESISLPANLTEIDDNAFDHCRKLTTVEWNNRVKRIGREAFYFTGLTRAIIPDSVTECGENCFDSTNISKVKFSKNMTTIPAGMLSSTKITNVVIPDYIKECGRYCFSDNLQLKSVTFSKNMTLIPEGMCYKTGITNVVIPGYIKTVEKYAFSVSNIKTVELQEGVENIHSKSFYIEWYKNKAVEVVIPKSLKKIELFANSDCISKFIYSANSDLSNSKEFKSASDNNTIDVATLRTNDKLYCKVQEVWINRGGETEGLYCLVNYTFNK